MTKHNEGRRETSCLAGFGTVLLIGDFTFFAIKRCTALCRVSFVRVIDEFTSGLETFCDKCSAGFFGLFLYLKCLY